MPRIENPHERTARYRSLMTQVSDDRALQALNDLCQELEAEPAPAEPDDEAEA